MQFLSLISVLVALFSTAQASVLMPEFIDHILHPESSVETVDKRTTCNSANVALIQSRLLHHYYFCQFYVAAPRAKSPMSDLSASAMFSACQCMVSVANTSPVAASTATGVALLNKEFYNPTAFCSFWTAAPRTRSAIPGASVAQISADCKLLTASTSTTTTTSTVEKAGATTTSTCSSNPLPTAVGDFVGGLEDWTPFASSNASYTTGTSYDSDGSAAVLKCEYNSGANAHASVCSETVPVCYGQEYTVSFKYKFPASGSIGGTLQLYNYSNDAILGTITGPTTSTTDSAGVTEGTWGSFSTTYTAASAGDLFLISLECLAGGETSGDTASVTIDNVRVVRVA